MQCYVDLKCTNSLNLYLLGNPNSGKTKFFNKLTKESGEVSNYSGVTVSERKSSIQLNKLRKTNIYDLPGTYSLIPRSSDEATTSKKIWEIMCLKDKYIVLAIIDITKIERGLYLLEQISELCIPFVIILTMSDKISLEKINFYVNKLSEVYKTSVIPVSSLSGFGFKKFINILKNENFLNKLKITMKSNGISSFAISKKFNKFWANGGKLIAAYFGLINCKRRHAYGSLALFYLGIQLSDKLLLKKDKKIKNWISFAKKEYFEFNKKIIKYRHIQINQFFYKINNNNYKKESLFSDEIDKIVLHPVIGSIFGFTIFVFMLEILFYVPDPLICFLSSIFTYASNVLKDILPSYWWFSSLFIDGGIVGIGSVLSFVPLIAILFFLIKLLEESGYLSRATFLLEKIMNKVGLPGKGFVPILSGFACAVPAIMATRVIDSTKQRLLTIMLIPFTSCSARLPVYGLLISSFFSHFPHIFGIINPSVLVLFFLYGIGLISIFISALIFKFFFFKNNQDDFLLELPDYRIPKMVDLVFDLKKKISSFLKDVGSIVLIMTIIMWVLFTFPVNQTNLTAIKVKKKIYIEKSYAGKVGKVIEPVISPLGFDWRIGVGLIASFSAREVFVSTIGIAIGLNQEDEYKKSLNEVLPLETNEVGKRIFTPLIAISLLIFFSLAMQCTSTLAATKKETGSMFLMFFQLMYMTLIAWLSSFTIYQMGVMCGF